MTDPIDQSTGMRTEQVNVNMFRVFVSIQATGSADILPTNVGLLAH
jgi:hypothetical protein